MSPISGSGDPSGSARDPSAGLGSCCLDLTLASLTSIPRVHQHNERISTTSSVYLRNSQLYSQHSLFAQQQQKTHQAKPRHTESSSAANINNSGSSLFYFHQQKRPFMPSNVAGQLKTPLTPPLYHKPPMVPLQKTPLTPPLIPKSSLGHLQHHISCQYTTQPLLLPQQYSSNRAFVRGHSTTSTTRPSAVNNKFMLGPTSTL